MISVSISLPRLLRTSMVTPNFSVLWLLKPPPRLMPRRFVDIGGDAAQDVPAALAGRILDADDLGAERGQPFCGAGPGQLPAEIADAYTRQGAGRRRGRAGWCLAQGMRALWTSTFISTPNVGIVSTTRAPLSNAGFQTRAW